MLPGYQNPRKKNETYHAHVDLHCPHCNPCRPAICNGRPKHGIAGYPEVISGVSRGGILGYPGVSGVSAHHLAHCCPPNGTNYNDSRHAKGYPGWGKQMLYNIRGSATPFRSSIAHLHVQHCTHAIRRPSPPRALHSRILQASF